MKHILTEKSAEEAKVLVKIVRHEPLNPVTVYHFSFLHNIHHLVQDPLLMSDAVWCYDIVSTCYGEVNTGDWRRVAEHKMKSELTSRGIPEVEQRLHYLVSHHNIH